MLGGLRQPMLPTRRFTPVFADAPLSAYVTDTPAKKREVATSPLSNKKVEPLPLRRDRRRYKHLRTKKEDENCNVENFRRAREKKRGR